MAVLISQWTQFSHMKLRKLQKEPDPLVAVRDQQLGLHSLLLQSVQDELKDL